MYTAAGFDPDLEINSREDEAFARQRNRQMDAGHQGAGI